VSVIATGFNNDDRNQRPSAEKSERKSEEFISLDEWVQMTSGRGSEEQRDLFGEESSFSEEFGIPAVLRYRRKSGGEG
jgi:hypothetical protein